MGIFQTVSGWIGEWAASPYAFWVLFALAFAESSFFPIPPDVLLIPLALGRPYLALVYALVTTLGSIIGGIFGYWLGLKGGRPLLLRLVRPERVRLVEHLYQRYDLWAVGLSAFGPIPYKIFTISAGVCLLSFRRFVLASFLGRAGRFFLVGLAIMILGPQAKELIENYLSITIIVFTIALIGGFWLVHYVSKLLHRRFGQEVGR